MTLGKEPGGRLLPYHFDASLSPGPSASSLPAKLTLAPEEAQNYPVLKHLPFVLSPPQGLSFLPLSLLPLSIFSEELCISLSLLLQFLFTVQLITMLSRPLQASDETTLEKVTND